MTPDCRLQVRPFVRIGTSTIDIAGVTNGVSFADNLWKQGVVLAEILRHPQPGSVCGLPLADLLKRRDRERHQSV